MNATVRNAGLALACVLLLIPLREDLGLMLSSNLGFSDGTNSATAVRIQVVLIHPF